MFTRLLSLWMLLGWSLIFAQQPIDSSSNKPTPSPDTNNSVVLTLEEARAIWTIVQMKEKYEKEVFPQIQKENEEIKELARQALVKQRAAEEHAAAVDAENEKLKTQVQQMDKSVFELEKSERKRRWRWLGWGVLIGIGIGAGIAAAN